MSIEEEYEANKAELGEALILITQVLDCRSLEDLNVLRRFLSEFVDRYSLRPLPHVDLLQIEPQELGHGHVTPRPDGVVMKCGGPGICAVCTAEKEALECWFCEGTGRVTVFSHGEDWTERCNHCGGTGNGEKP